MAILYALTLLAYVPFHGTRYAATDWLPLVETSAPRSSDEVQFTTGY